MVGACGFLSIAIVVKGIPREIVRDGTVINLVGRVIRIRPDGTGVEIVLTGER